MTTRTPGPWHNQGNYVYSKKNIAMVARCPDNKPIEQAIADAEFIAGCENENGRLRDEVERLRNAMYSAAVDIDNDRCKVAWNTLVTALEQPSKQDG